MPTLRSTHRPAQRPGGRLPSPLAALLAAGVALWLSACGGADRPSDASAAPSREEASSSELIDVAQARDELDNDSALVYRAYALFGDTRLPTRYVGGQAEELDSTEVARLQAAMGDTAPSTQSHISSLLRRPNAAGEWQSISPSGGRFSVWHASGRAKDGALAQALSQALEQDTWPGQLASRSLDNRLQAAAAAGGVGRIDVFLVHGIAASTLAVHPQGGAATLPFVLVNADMADATGAAQQEVVQALLGNPPGVPALSAPRSRALATALAEPGVAVPPTVVQAKGASLPAGSSTLTLDQPVTAGNWIAIAVSAINMNPASITLADSQGLKNSAFAKAAGRYSSSFGTVWRYAKLTQSGGYSLTFSRGTATSATVQVFELAGVDPTTFNDIAAVSAAGNTTTAASTFGTATITPNDLLLSVIAVRSTTATLAPTSPAGLQALGQQQDGVSSATVYGLGTNITERYRIAATLSIKNLWRISSLAVRGVAPPPVVIAPVNTTPPAITMTGTATPFTLSASTGTWANGPTGYAYAWQRNGQPIDGATASTYTSATADEGSALAVTVTASNSAGGASATSTAVQIPVPPPPGAPTLTFTATPPSIYTGQSSTLAWSSSNTTACTAGGDWSGPQATSGSLVVTPTATSTYTLDCAGDTGSIAAQVTVTVSAEPPPVMPATGAHGSAFHISRGSVGPWLPTPPMATQAAGSTMLVFVGKGSVWNLAPPIDNKGNSPYVQVGPIHEYKKWPGEGTALYSFLRMAGGDSHIVSVNDSNTWDEVSFAAVEVKNGGVIVDHKWNEVLNSPTHTTLTVTTTGPATLVAAWFGDDASSTPSNPVPGDGFTVVEAVRGAVETVQMVVATRDVSAAGTYSMTWTTTPVQGAQLYLVAVQKAP